MPIMFPRKILQRNLSPTDTPADNEVLTFDSALNLWNAEAAAGGQTFAKVVKAVDESVISSTTLQDDDVLKFTPTINKTYSILLAVIFDSAANADLKSGWSVPSGATLIRNLGVLSSGTPVNFGDWVGAVNFVTDGLQEVLYTFGRLVMSSTAGECNWQFAQLVSRATNTTVQKGSTLLVWEENA